MIGKPKTPTDWILLKFEWGNTTINKLKSIGKEFYVKRNNNDWVSSQDGSFVWDGKITNQGFVVEDINEYDWCILKDPSKYKGKFTKEGYKNLHEWWLNGELE